MTAAVELQKIITDTLLRSVTDEKVINALNRQTFSTQDKIIGVIEKGDVKVAFQRIRTNKFVNDHSVIFKDTNKIVNQVRQQEKIVVKALNDVNTKFDTISESTKYISSGIDTLTQGMGVLTNLAYLNVALSAANLCATLVTFAIMNKKLDSIQCGIDDISRKIDQIIQAKEIDISIDIKELVLDYRHILDMEEKKEKISLKEYRELLKNIYLYELKLIQYYLNGTTTNPNEILSAIYLLSGILAQIIKKYDELYYFEYMNEKNSIDPDHGEWMKVFELLSSKEFLDLVSDQCFFGNNMSNRKTQEVLSRLYYSQVSNMVIIDDNNLITHQCQNIDELSQLRSRVNELAYVELCDQIEDNYKETDNEVSKEEMEQKTKEAAIKLGYIKA